MRRIRQHLTYANVMATIAVFLVLSGGTAVALSGSNTVFSDDIVNGQVKPQDLAPAPTIIGAGLPDACSTTTWSNDRDLDFNRAGYYRDPYGRVFLRGAVQNCGYSGDTIFTLPPGYRPGKHEVQMGAGGSDQTPEVDIDAVGGTVRAPGQPTNSPPVWLDGLSFRCGPPGQNGCP
jgi:hypothetical protein